MDIPREYLKKLRAEHDLTMQEVADSFGISRQYYNLIEAGVSQKRMDITLVRRISDLFELPVETIMDYEAELTKQRTDAETAAAEAEAAAAGAEVTAMAMEQG